jgi:hypothetical protein
MQKPCFLLEERVKLSLILGAGDQGGVLERWLPERDASARLKGLLILREESVVDEAAKHAADDRCDPE